MGPIPLHCRQVILDFVKRLGITELLEHNLLVLEDELKALVAL